MANLNGKITAPVKVTDVKQVLGVSENRISYLCKHSNVNMWSKYKPFRNGNTALASESASQNAAKATNYGLSIPQQNMTTVTNDTLSGWTYNKPRGVANNEPYRLGDFRKYNHDATPPLTFTFSNGGTEYIYNEYLSGTLPNIYVNAKISDTQCSNLVNSADITLNDLNVDGTTTDKVGNYLGCVTNRGLIANTEDTLNCKYGTNINGNVINLSKYTISSMFTDDTDSSYYPSGASGKKKLILYPRINKFIPGALGKVRNSGGAPSTATGLNGYYTAATYPFISVPQAQPLVIRKYKWTPLSINYAYVSITHNVSSFVSMWPYISSNESHTASFQKLGGKTLIFGDAQVILKIVATISNKDSSRTISIKPYSVQGSIFPTTTRVSMYSGSTTTGPILSSLALEPNSTATITIHATYPAGSRSNYTFPSITSPGYGTERPTIKLRMSVSGNGYGTEFIPDANAFEQLRWR